MDDRDEQKAEGTAMKAPGRLAVIGAGKMGGTLALALVEAGSYRRGDVVATVGHGPSVERARDRLGVEVTTDNREAVRGAGLVLVCVKPQLLGGVLDEIGELLRPEQLLVSVVASAGTAYIESHVAGPVPVVRAMPNTPALLRVGMTALAPGRHARPEHLSRAEAVFGAVGRTVVLDESHFDAVTALGASGPAYGYVVIEALAEGGVKVGLPRHVATELVTQAILGAATMVLETGKHPALLKDDVTTPAGCTIDGLLELEAGGLRVSLIKAVMESARRSSELLPPD